ncbi:lipocalin-like domain-containing protein [Bradyrhizobium sp. 141]|uniref:lipocalin-like domain-containing protein n=1 Tax=Bradyrhizobium sp. 141 TaxID=2782617 RepID=UPI001FF82CD9|nr:lipocalin-like domain-containing protein [Bradyrhizobium sp. 141]MCK1716248.1 lipocalin-like domain-containing protein [Bradyrhizobium sp. 141]
MKSVLMSAVAFAFLLTTMPKLSAGEDLASSIVGTWKLTSFARKEVATGKIDHAPYGEHARGYAYYTKGGNFLTFTVSQDRKKIEKVEPTDAERAELFKSMYAWGGTYKTDGSKVIYNVDIAWIQSWVGTTRTYQAEMAGNKLTVTTQPFKSPVDGQDIVVITTYDRAE